MRDVLAAVSAVVLLALTLAYFATQVATDVSRSADGREASDRPQMIPIRQHRRSAPPTCRVRGGLPDPACTPGDVIERDDEATVCNPRFSTRAVRDTSTTREQKQELYRTYGIRHPRHNNDRTQVCEIDHLVPLELGGADTRENLWVECSPGYDGWDGPGFRDKDDFENWLWNQVCVQRAMTLRDAQQQIAHDWLRHWNAAGRPRCERRRTCD